MIAGYLNDGQRAFLYDLSAGNFEGVLGGTIVSQTFEARFCLIAQHSIHDQPATTAIRSLQIRAGELDDWMNRAILSAEVVDDQPAQVALKVSYDRAPKRFSMPMGELHLAKITTDPTMIAGPYSSRNLNFRQESLIQLTVRQERTLEDWRQAFLDIEGLFALLLGSYFDLGWPGLICPHADGKDLFKFYFRRDGAVRSYKPAIHNALLMWTWVEDSFGSTLAGWIDFKRKHLTACSHFMTTLLRQDIHLEHRFVTLMWSFEVLHRGVFPSDPRSLEKRVSEVMTVLEDKLNNRTREWVRRKLSRLDEISLEQRIRELLEDLPIPATSEAVRRFAGKCADYRNDLSHFGGPRNHPPAEGYYEELSSLTEALQLLFGAILLSRSGISRELIAKAFKETPYAKIRLLRLLLNADLQETARADSFR